MNSSNFDMEKLISGNSFHFETFNKEYLWTPIINRQFFTNNRIFSIAKSLLMYGSNGADNYVDFEETGYSERVHHRTYASSTIHYVDSHTRTYIDLPDELLQQSYQAEGLCVWLSMCLSVNSLQKLTVIHHCWGK